MPEPTPTPGFTAEQLPTIGRLSTALSFLGPLLVVAGIARLALGVVEIWKTSWSGLLTLPEGALLAFAGLAFIAASTDAFYLRDVKGREKEHLSHTLDSINVGFTALLILGCYVAVIAFITLLV